MPVPWPSCSFVEENVIIIVIISITFFIASVRVYVWMCVLCSNPILSRKHNIPNSRTATLVLNAKHTTVDLLEQEQVFVRKKKKKKIQTDMVRQDNNNTGRTRNTPYHV